MAQLGINVDAAGRATPADIAATGATWVRLVALRDQDTEHLVLSYAAAGLETLLVLAKESFDGFRDQGTAAQVYAQRTAAAIGALQVGNEADLQSPSSWSQTQGQLAGLLRTVRTAFAAAGYRGPLIGPGLASGQPGWWNDELNGLVDALAVHPYGQRADPSIPAPTGNFGYVGDLLAGYRRWKRPLWVTEFGSDAADQQRQASYVGAMARRLAQQTDVPAAFVFCWADWMVPPFGLLDARGLDKPACRAFSDVATSLHRKETSVPKFVLGFATYAQQHPEVGQPLEDEQSLAAGYQTQMTTNGLLVYSKQANQVQFLPAGKA